MGTKVMHVVRAGCHLGQPNRLAPETERTRLTRQWLHRLVTLVGRAKYEVAVTLKAFIQIEKGEDGEIKLVTLELPVVDEGLVRAARNLLDPKRPPDPRGNRIKKPKKRKKKTWEEMTNRERAQPQYLNSYRLVAPIERPGESPLLRFELLRRYSYPDKKGKLRTGVTILDAKIGWQRLITTWVRPPIFDRLPPALRNGVAQKVAQEIGSHFGLIESGSQSRVSWPDLSDCDPRINRQRYEDALALVAASGTEEMRGGDLVLKPLRQLTRGRFAKDDPRGDELRPVGEHWKQIASPLRLKRAPLLFTDSNQLVVWEQRRQMPNGKHERRLTVSMPLANWPDHEPPAHLLAWRERPGEYTPLLAWAGYKLRPTKPLIMLPLAVEGGYRRLRRTTDVKSPQQGAFVQSLNGELWTPCWGEVIEIGNGEFRCHFTLMKEIEPVPRPGLLAVHFAKPEESHPGVRLYMAHSPVGGEIRHIPEVINLDRIDAPRGQRREWAIQAARRVIEVAQATDSDIALEQVTGLKKRGQPAGEGVRATRFNYSDIEHWIVNLAAKRAQPPIVIQPIFLKANLTFDSHEERAQQVLLGALALRQRPEC